MRSLVLPGLLCLAACFGCGESSGLDSAYSVDVLLSGAELRSGGSSILYTHESQGEAELRFDTGTMGIAGAHYSLHCVLRGPVGEGSVTLPQGQRCELHALPPGSSVEGYVELGRGQLAIGEHTLTGTLPARTVVGSTHEGTFELRATRHVTRIHN